jgi:hypothetical protein
MPTGALALNDGSSHALDCCDGRFGFNSKDAAPPIESTVLESMACKQFADTHGTVTNKLIPKRLQDTNTACLSSKNWGARWWQQATHDVAGGQPTARDFGA